MVNMLIDFCSPAIRRELEYPYIGPKLSEALRGAEISAPHSAC
jgi:4-hydroxyphenylacetate 3-monooxygenase